MKFSNHLKYSRGISNTEWEGLTKPAVTIILNQFLYWWSSDRITQHSHLTVSTCVFYPHHATRAFDSSDSIRVIQEKVGGRKGSESQSRSQADHTSHLAEHRPDLTHPWQWTRRSEQTVEKKVRTIPLVSHITTVWSPPFLYASSNTYQVFHEIN